MVLEIIVLIIVIAVILPVVLSMLFSAQFNRPVESVFYNQDSLVTDFNINDNPTRGWKVVAQTGSLFDGKRITSVSIVMDNSQGVTVGNISVGIYSINATSAVLEKLFDTMPVTNIPSGFTTFQYDTDYVMDSDDAVAVVASGFNDIAGEFIEVHASNLDPIPNTNIMSQDGSDPFFDWVNYDMRAIMIETQEVEDTEFVTLIGILALIALVILVLIMLRGRLE